MYLNDQLVCIGSSALLLSQLISGCDPLEDLSFRYSISTTPELPKEL